MGQLLAERIGLFLIRIDYDEAHTTFLICRINGTRTLLPSQININFVQLIDLPA